MESEITAHVSLTRQTIMTGIVVLMLGILTSFQAGISREYRIKAAFLYNFTQFVDWPSDAYEAPDSPFVIGIFGEDPFGAYLDQLVAGERVRNHPIVIHRYKEIADLGDCHLLYVNASGKNEQLFAALSDKHVLTVSDQAGFAKSKGIIEFYTQENKTRFFVNLNNANDQNIQISSKLLRLAEII